MWKMIPKFHAFQHMCELNAQMCGDPRFWWCYSDEDMVGFMIEVAEACHRSTMASTGLFKWLVLLDLRQQGVAIESKKRKRR